jgi:hypothetical protein
MKPFKEEDHDRNKLGKFAPMSGAGSSSGSGKGGGKDAPVIGTTGNRPGDFVTFNGSSNLASISADVVKAQTRGGGLKALPIRLQVGYTGPKGIHKGFGLRHIEVEHGDDIKASGLSAAQYVHQFFRNVQRIYEEQDGVFFFQTRIRNGKTAMVRLAREGDFYTVHTLYEKTLKNLGKLIWSGRPTGLAPSGQDGRPAFGQATTTADSLDESLAAPPSHLRGVNPASVTGSPNSARPGLASQISEVDFTQPLSEFQRYMASVRPPERPMLFLYTCSAIQAAKAANAADSANQDNFVTRYLRASATRR